MTEQEVRIAEVSARQVRTNELRIIRRPVLVQEPDIFKLVEVLQQLWQTRNGPEWRDVPVVDE